MGLLIGYYLKSGLKKVDSMLFSEYLEIWIPFESSKPSFKHMHYFLKTLEREFGNSEIEKIRRRDIDIFIQNRRSHVSEASLLREVNFFASALNTAVMWEIISSSPLAGYRRKYVYNHRFRILSAEESVILFSMLDRAGPKTQAVISVLHDTGCRPGELRAAARRDFDKDFSFLTIRKSKTGTARKIFFSHRARMRIITWLSSCTDEFPFEHWPKKNIERILSNFENIVLYDLRKTFITRALREGIDPKTVSICVGSSIETILKFYTRVDEADIKNAFLKTSSVSERKTQLRLLENENA